jgi:hypothetical protein
MILYDCQRTGHTLNPPVFLRAVDGKGLFGGVDVVVDAGCSGTLSTHFLDGVLEQSPANSVSRQR